MKAVLISIQPKWVEKIANGEKTIEVRKTKPKLETPFKVYIYCTNDRKLFLDSDCNNKFWAEKNYGGEHYYNGKVIGEFVCDCVDDMPYVTSAVEGTMIPRYVGNNESCTCLSEIEIFKYGRGNLLYAWHISDLKIYDKPKELGEFYIKCEKGNCRMCDWEREYDVCACKYKKPIERPPQSWCYVEELQNG